MWPTAITASSDRFSLFMLARTCSKFWFCIVCSQHQRHVSIFTSHRCPAEAGSGQETDEVWFGTMAISSISAWRCCSKYDISLVPGTAEVDLLWAAILFLLRFFTKTRVESVGNDERKCNWLLKRGNLYSTARNPNPYRYHLAGWLAARDLLLCQQTLSSAVVIFLCNSGRLMGEGMLPGLLFCVRPVWHELMTSESQGKSADLRLQKDPSSLSRTCVAFGWQGHCFVVIRNREVGCSVWELSFVWQGFLQTRPCAVALPVLMRLTGYGTGSLHQPLRNEYPACFRNAVGLEGFWGIGFRLWLWRW
jgi:hypothetical protein